MTGLREFNAEELARDVRVGLDPPALMIKYGMTEERLHQIVEEMAQSGLIDASELDCRWVGAVPGAAASSDCSGEGTGLLSRLGLGSSLARVSRGLAKMVGKKEAG